MEEFESKDKKYDKVELKRLEMSEIERLSSLLMHLECSNRLCHPSVEKIVAEFGFKGSREAVWRQLLDILDRYATEGMTQEDALRADENASRLAKWNGRHSRRQDFYNVKAREALEDVDITKMVELRVAQSRRKKLLHDKKECLCYVNRIGE